MTSIEFQEKLKEVFVSHCFSFGRDQHTINELMHVLTYDKEFSKGNWNISIRRLDYSWTSIPCMDAFVNVGTRGIWFNDADVEYEVDECEGIKFDCVTVYETERSD
jgi:hypothetical protein